MNGSEAFDQYFSDRDIDPLSLTVWQMGELPFADLFPRAESFDSNQWVHNHLPYDGDRGQLFMSGTKVLLWHCNWCTFWTDMLDQRILEEHLIKRCVGIPPDERESYKMLVLENVVHHCGVLLARSVSTESRP